MPIRAILGWSVATILSFVLGYEFALEHWFVAVVSAFLGYWEARR